jgi:hypothetical protein
MLAIVIVRTKIMEETNKSTDSIPDYCITPVEVKRFEKTGFANELKYFKETSRNLFSESLDGSIIKSTE